MNCTTTPMETLTDAVRLAFEKAMPSKVAASWGHANGLNIAGWDTRTNEEFVTMVLATIISGGGATPHQDGWHAVGPECCFGALTSGDVELLEYSYPIIIHRYSLMTDFRRRRKIPRRLGHGLGGRAARQGDAVHRLRRGPAHPGDGRGGRVIARSTRRSAASSSSAAARSKWQRINILETIQPGETITNMNPGGGGYGNPYERPVEKVRRDVKNGLVSVAGRRGGLWRRHLRS